MDNHAPDTLEKVTCQEAAKLLNINITTVYKYRKDRVIIAEKGKRNGRRVWLINTKDLNKLKNKLSRQSQERAIIFFSSSKQSNFKCIKKATDYCKKFKLKYKLVNQETLYKESFEHRIITRGIQRLIDQLHIENKSTKLILVGSPLCQRHKYVVDIAKQLELKIVDLTL